MWEVSQTWKPLREERLERLTRNLRTTIVLALLQELTQRLVRIREVQAARSAAIARGCTAQVHEFGVFTDLANGRSAKIPGLTYYGGLSWQGVGFRVSHVFGPGYF